ncbi:MAG TPA: DUF447 domain-containing protein [Pirellulales bacterium]
MTLEAIGILEGIVTTINADGSVNVSPMGPEVDVDMQHLVLKPFRTSTTYANLKRTGQGVFHVTDDVELLAQAAVGTPDPLPRMTRSEAVDGWILADACRWYAFRTSAIDDAQERTRIETEVVAHGRLRDFFGFHRARHAVLEAAILATRTGLLPADEIFAQLERLRPLVEKTGGASEKRAWAFLERVIHDRCAR